MEAAKSIPHVIAVAGTREHPMSMTVDGVERAVNLVGVTDGYQTIRRLLILRGRYFDTADMEMRSKVCLITTQLAERIFGQENPIRRPIRMGELTFTVIGVFRERVETFGLSEIQENSVLIPFTLMKYYTGTEYFASTDGGADHHCSHRPVDQRNRHHEHHAGDGDGTDAGNWNSQGNRGCAAGDPVPVPGRVIFYQWRRSRGWDFARDRPAGD